jgi:hypothetical protein
VTHARYPPPRGNLLVPLSSRSAATAGISMWSACRPMARFVRTVTYHSVRLLGTFPMRLLPSVEWEAPVEPPLWNELSALWASWFGRFDELALYRPTQERRNGFAALLLAEGNQLGFVKWRANWDFEAEARSIEVVSGARSFTTPSLAGVSTVPAWSTIGLAPITSGLHSARLHAPAVDLAAEISQLLDPLLPPDPEHEQWEPMHGDMGPWNLRHLDGTGPILFDWELARRAPPGADVVFHAAASRAMRLKTNIDSSTFGEAAGFWAEEIRSRFAGSARDQRLAESMLSELRRFS